MKISGKAKAVVAAIGGLATALSPVLADDVIGLDETSGVIAALVFAIATVAGVYGVRNGKKPEDLANAGQVDAPLGE
ncbi:hypothetical protein [Amycolatopsis thermophila]|uniref:Holin n=1 Tax=Amycolatopsis thermophila TaxID=206084 RepID=A0ABU0ENT6_9PSEU|nr:hypothetical protein [Amycolatopsis thermophila]MDQ0376477.1 hypothetical protein [Amycolatopsis thermophila]